MNGDNKIGVRETSREDLQGLENDLIWEVRERDTPRKTDILIPGDQGNDGAIYKNRKIRKSQLGRQYNKFKLGLSSPPNQAQKKVTCALRTSLFFPTCRCTKKSNISLRPEAEYTKG